MDIDIKVGATATYNADDYWGDSVILGALSLVNACMPLVAWAWIMAPLYGKMTTNPVFLYAWTGMQAGHLLAYAVSALAWPFIYIGGSSVSFIRALFAYSWTYWGQGAGIAAAGFTIATLMASSYEYQRVGDRDAHGELLLELTDIWSTLVLYLFSQTMAFYVGYQYAPGAMRYVGFDADLGHDFDRDGVYGG